MSRVTLQEALSGIYEVGTRVTEAEGREIWEAWYKKMPSCVAQGADEPGAIQRLGEYREAYLRRLDELGSPLPEPDGYRVEPSAEAESTTYSHLAGTSRMYRLFQAPDTIQAHPEDGDELLRLALA